MANCDYTYDQVAGGTGTFQQDNQYSVSVKRLQTRMRRAGYPCGPGSAVEETADGYLGTNTANAVMLFQSVHGMPTTGIVNNTFLYLLNPISSESDAERYGRELTTTELHAGYSNPPMCDVEALARTIYGEDTWRTLGQNAVARELNNRKNPEAGRGLDFDLLSSSSPTWKGLVYGAQQYTVMTGDVNSQSRRPELYGLEWTHYVKLSSTLVQGLIPSSSLGWRYYHNANDPNEIDPNVPVYDVYEYLQIANIFEASCMIVGKSEYYGVASICQNSYVPMFSLNLLLRGS
ncbi:MAG: peptidoglycan-binding protein [Clostridium sp.]|jgi:peptidoglycan hydrolase-like protein with peptidoglycan-binding domain|nr:peptidoglycan-binding protein [Clostridium sp.]